LSQCHRWFRKSALGNSNDHVSSPDRKCPDDNAARCRRRGLRGRAASRLRPRALPFPLRPSACSTDFSQPVGAATVQTLLDVNQRRNSELRLHRKVWIIVSDRPPFRARLSWSFLISLGVHHSVVSAYHILITHDHVNTVHVFCDAVSRLKFSHCPGKNFGVSAWLAVARRRSAAWSRL